MHPTSCSAKTVEKQRNSILFPFFLPYFCKEFLLQNVLYFENRFCIFPYPVFPNLCDAHLSAQRRRWVRDVALGVQHQQGSAKCLGTRTGCLVLLGNACHDFSACERYTLSWAQNSSGNPHAHIAFIR